MSQRENEPSDPSKPKINVTAPIQTLERSYVVWWQPHRSHDTPKVSARYTREGCEEVEEDGHGVRVLLHSRESHSAILSYNIIYHLLALDKQTLRWTGYGLKLARQRGYEGSCDDFAISVGKNSGARVRKLPSDYCFIVAMDPFRDQG